MFQGGFSGLVGLPKLLEDGLCQWVAVLVRVDQQSCLFEVLICLFKALHVLHTIDKSLLRSCIELVDQEDLVECQLRIKGLVLGQVGASKL